MARVTVYLNFAGAAEAAFTFYREVFGGQFTTFMRMSDMPPNPDGPALPDSELPLVMHVELPILGGASALMGTDVLESMGHTLTVGNNTTINLEPDTLAETQRLFDALSEGATDVAPLTQQFWGSWWGTCLDRFGVRWMFNGPREEQVPAGE